MYFIYWDSFYDSDDNKKRQQKRNASAKRTSNKIEKKIKVSTRENQSKDEDISLYRLSRKRPASLREKCIDDAYKEVYRTRIKYVYELIICQ